MLLVLVTSSSGCIAQRCILASYRATVAPHILYTVQVRQVYISFTTCLYMLVGLVPTGKLQQV